MKQFQSLNLVLRIAFFLLHLHLSQSSEPGRANVTIFGSCNFAEPTFPLRNEMSVHATIPERSAKLDILFCDVWYTSSKGVLRLWLQKTSYGNQTSLISTVLDQHGSLVLPGYVAEAEEKVSYPFHICPALDKSSGRNYSIFLSAPPKTGINLTVQVDESILLEGQTKSLEIGHKVPSRLLDFDVSSIQGIYDHFQVTVRSDSRDQECLLIVSNECSNVINIDPQVISFKNSGQAIRLSFTTFGRITLSHSSSPQLSPGRWYIGIFLKHPENNRNQIVMKTVEVSVGFAGGINRVSLRAPVAYLALVSLFGGLVVSVFAHFFLYPDLENRLVRSFRRYVTSRILNATHGKDQADAGEHQMNNVESQEEASPMNETRDATISRSPSISIDQVRYDGNTATLTPYDISTLDVPKQWPGFKIWATVILGWFYHEEKTFAYTTAIVAFSLMTGAVQFIISNWRDMIDGGNRDICYYNEGCYRAMTTVDIPYNLIISNLSYVIHAIILALFISLREATCLVNNWKTCYSIPYALAWALFFEGIFSSIYHLCPSRMTFQFDSAFMFVICGLVVTAMFNAVEEKARRPGHLELQGGCSVAPVRDTKLFLFFVVPILLLNYLGTIRDTDGFLLFQDWVFYFLTVLWILAMLFWVFYRLMMPWKRTPGPSFWCKFAWLCVLFPLILLVIGLYTIDVKRDWSNFFLFSCLASVLCSVMGYVLTKCSRNIYNNTKRRRDLSAEEQNELQWTLYLKWPLVNLHIVVYIAVVAFCWILALYYFLHKPVTEKVILPSRSRELNKECVLWEFFDYHDLWHILSSFALLQTAYLILWSIG